MNSKVIFEKIDAQKQILPSVDLRTQIQGHDIETIRTLFEGIKWFFCVENIKTYRRILGYYLQR